LRLEQWIWPGYLLAFIIGLLGIRSLLQDKAKATLYKWTILSVLLLAVAFISTKTATGPHHSSVLSGLWQFALAPLVGAFWDAAPSRAPRTRPFVIPLIVCSSLVLIVTANIIGNIICVRAFAHTSNPNWDPANMRASLFAQEHANARFISTDWGIGTQMITVTRDRPDINDAWPTFTSQDDAVQFIKGFPRDRDVYVYVRFPGFENFKGNRDNLLYALEKNHIGYQVSKTYADWQGKPMIGILKLGPPEK
jgi:hypothetical protein